MICFQFAGRLPTEFEKSPIQGEYEAYDAAKTAIEKLKNVPVVDATVLHQKTMDKQFNALLEEHAGGAKVALPGQEHKGSTSMQQRKMNTAARTSSKSAAVHNPAGGAAKVVKNGGEPLTSQAALDYFRIDSDHSADPSPPSVKIGDIILDMQRRLDYDMLEPLVEDFEEQVKEEVLNIASVPTSEIALRERKVELARLRDARAQARAYHERELDLAWREQSARDRVLEMEECVRRRAREEDLLLRTFREDHRQSVKRDFARAKTNLEGAIAKQRGRVYELYGQPELRGRAAARRYRVDWNSKPRPVEVRVHLLRSVRDKLPSGRYSMLMSMHDRLGGCPLTWSKAGTDAPDVGQRPSATKPRVHHGRYYDGEFRVEQSIFALCPSDDRLHPSNVFIFELYRLADAADRQDTVVGWGVLPMCDGYFSVIKGCFKVPLLKGGVDRTIDLHGSYEEQYRKNLSCWLANVYVEVRHLPRETLDSSGAYRTEYDVEYDFVNSLLNLEDADVEMRRELKQSTAPDEELTKDSRPEEKPWGNGSLGWFSRRGSIFGYIKPQREGQRTKSGGDSNSTEDVEKVDESPDVQLKGDPLYDEQERVKDEGYGSGDEYFFPPETLNHVVGVEATSAGLSGIRKRRRGDGARWDPGGLALLQRKETPQVDQSNVSAENWRSLETESDLDAFTMSVAPDEARRADVPMHILFYSKIRYFVQEIFTDREHNIHATEFWYNILSIIIGVWFRMYVHYFGQWIYLKANSTPLFDFQVFAHRVQYKYMFTSMSTGIEIGFVLMGPVSNICVLAILTLTGHIAIKIAGKVQDWFSKFALAFAIGTILDPLLIFIVDLLIENYACSQRRGCQEDLLASSCHCTGGDAFKLWVRMESEDSSGVVGLLIVAVIYVGVTIVAIGFVYIYLKHVHMNGRMLDIYRRVNSSADDLFIPHDYEISERELRAICAYAKRWRGVGGEHRIVSHCDYEFVDPVMLQSTSEKTTHLAIHTCNPADGSRSLWRQFIRSPDGAVLEVVSNTSAALSSEVRGLEKLLEGGNGGAGIGEIEGRGYFAGAV